MESEVRPLSNEEIAQFAIIAKGAYPSMGGSVDDLTERLRNGQVENPATRMFGLFRDQALLGGMRFFDFTMYYRGLELPIGGVGFVAVDLMHKKEHVARDMIRAFLRHYRERGAPLASLYPFRPDFYRQMGFGYGAKLSHYKIKPDSFPRGSRANLRVLSRADAPALLECYHRYAAKSHGLYARSAVWGRIFDDPNLRAIGYFAGEELQGYLLYSFKVGAVFGQNDIEVRELIYENPVALGELFAFLHSQADQFLSVLMNIQDDHLSHIIHDPRNGSGNMYLLYQETNAQAIGIMYRVVDTPGFFKALAAHNFGGQNIVVAFDVADSFLPENAGETIVRFVNGKAEVAPDATPDVRIALSIELFSSLVMGVVDAAQLYRYGAAQVDKPEYLGALNQLFWSAEKPICLTSF